MIRAGIRVGAGTGEGKEVGGAETVEVPSGSGIAVKGAGVAGETVGGANAGVGEKRQDEPPRTTSMSMLHHDNVCLCIAPLHSSWYDHH